MTDKVTPALMSAKLIIPLLGVSRAHFYVMLGEGKFPAPCLKDGPRFIRWRASVVNNWLADPQAWIDANPAKGEIK